MIAPDRLGLAIDPATNDLALDATGNLAVVTNAHAVGQHIRQCLMTYRGEWFLNPATGVPWLDQVMGRRFDPALAEAVLKAAVYRVDGVREITSFGIGFQMDRRNLDYRNITVTTDYEMEVSL